MDHNFTDYFLFLTASLDKKVRELYAAVCRLEEEKYDWEARLGRQTEEVATLEMCFLSSIFILSIRLETSSVFWESSTDYLMSPIRSVK